MSIEQRCRMCVWVLTGLTAVLSQPVLGAEAASPAHRATVYRDEFGIPHVFATTEPAGAYALGIALAEDNAPQIFENLLLCTGRAAEVRGEGQLDRDISIRRWRIPETGRQMWQDSPPDTRRFIQAYSDGLNTYRQQHLDELPDTLPATPQQVLTLFKYVQIWPSTAIVDADISQTLDSTKKPDEIPGNSSTFAIGGSRTASGKPMLLIDPHWPATGFFSFSEHHLHAGRYDIGGFGIHGVPVAALGYTPGVAWGGTAGGADAADAFEIRVHPEDPHKYFYDEQWKEMVVRTEKIRVKTDNGTEVREVAFRETVHGPIVHEEDGRTFAGAVSRWRDTGVMEQFLACNRARNRDDFMRALKMDQKIWLNICFVTSDGDLGYIQTGSCPIRPERPGEFLALDGTRSAANWQGMVPFDELPQLHNPPVDWMQSCNTAASDTITDMQMTPDMFSPGVLFGHYPFNGINWRGRRDRLFELLPQMKAATLDDFRQVALDTYCPIAGIWPSAVYLAYAGQASEIDDPAGDVRRAAEAIRDWDGHSVKDSIGATIFRFWRKEYAELQPSAFGDAQKRTYPQTPEEKADAVVALQRGVQQMKKLYGKIDVPWGDVFRLRRGGIDLPLDGGGGGGMACECLRSAGGSGLTDDGHVVFNGGQVVTTVVEMTDPVNVRSIMPYGQSLRDGHKHSTDQMQLYSQCRMRPAWHTREQLEGHIESTVEIVYEPTERGK